MAPPSLALIQLPARPLELTPCSWCCFDVSQSIRQPESLTLNELGWDVADSTVTCTRYGPCNNLRISRWNSMKTYLMVCSLCEYSDLGDRMELHEDNSIMCYNQDDCYRRLKELQKSKACTLCRFSGREKTFINGDLICEDKCRNLNMIRRLAKLKTLETSKPCSSCGISGKSKIDHPPSYCGTNLFCSEECKNLRRLEV